MLLLASDVGLAGTLTSSTHSTYLYTVGSDLCTSLSREELFMPWTPKPLSLLPRDSLINQPSPFSSLTSSPWAQCDQYLSILKFLHLYHKYKTLHLSSAHSSGFSSSFTVKLLQELYLFHLPIPHLPVSPQPTLLASLPPTLCRERLTR